MFLPSIAPKLNFEQGQVQSWDAASTTGDARDWSVCTTWLAFKRNYYLLDVWRGRLEFPRLKHQLIALARDHAPNRILIERAGPGLHLIQEFRANPVPGVPMPIGIKPEGDKLVRMEAQCARFEAGQVYLPREAPWLSELLHEILSFPNSRYDDQIDSISQFLKRAEANEPTFAMVGACGKIFCDGQEVPAGRLFDRGAIYWDGNAGVPGRWRMQSALVAAVKALRPRKGAAF